VHPANVWILGATTISSSIEIAWRGPGDRLAWAKGEHTDPLKKMTKLLIYIGENQKFDREVTTNAIVAMSGTTNARHGNFIGAIFECEYGYAGVNTVIRMSEKAETITAEGLHPCSLAFAIELQLAIAADLNATDMGNSFNVALRDFQTVEQLEQAIDN
jgi:hypothetical protein